MLCSNKSDWFAQLQSKFCFAFFKFKKAFYELFTNLNSTWTTSLVCDPEEEKKHTGKQKETHCSKMRSHRANRFFASKQNKAKPPGSWRCHDKLAATRNVLGLLGRCGSVAQIRPVNPFRRDGRCWSGWNRSRCFWPLFHLISIHLLRLQKYFKNKLFSSITPELDFNLASPYILQIYFLHVDVENN